MIPRKYPFCASPIVPATPTHPGWRWHRLTDVARLATGHTPSRRHPEYWLGDIPWIQLADIRKLDGKEAFDSMEHTNESGLANSAAVLLPKATVCLSRTASVGFVTLMGRPMATSQDFVNWICGPEIDPWFLMYLLLACRKPIVDLGSGAVHHTIYFPTVENFSVCIPPYSEQRGIAALLRAQMTTAENARAAAGARLEAALALPAALARDTVRNGTTGRCSLGDCLVEVRNGVGAEWAKYPVLGATRGGLAPAKEAIGKAPERYKLVDPVTVFYNPMRILLGSIAMVDEDDAAGITSPDYVVVKGRPGVLDTRWFYYWFRSAKGAHLIESLSRGAVRERILFNPLAAGEIEIPDYKTQRLASERMQQVRPLVDSIRKELEIINALPAAILRRVFAGAV